MLRKVVPGTDEYITEKYAFEIMRALEEWSRALKEAAPALGVLAKFLDASVEARPLAPTQQTTLRSQGGIEIIRRQFSAGVVPGRERLLQEMKTYLEADFALRDGGIPNYSDRRYCRFVSDIQDRDSV